METVVRSNYANPAKIEVTVVEAIRCIRDQRQRKIIQVGSPAKFAEPWAATEKVQTHSTLPYVHTIQQLYL